MTIEEKVRDYLKEEGISCAKAAVILGLTEASLKALLEGRRKMRADELIAFCEYFALDTGFMKVKKIAAALC